MTGHRLASAGSLFTETSFDGLQEFIRKVLERNTSPSGDERPDLS
jgi:hypothetical protein